VDTSIVLGSPFPNFKRRVWKSTMCRRQEVMSSARKKKDMYSRFGCGTGREMKKQMAN